MKVLLDIKDNKADSFMKLVSNIDYVNVLKEVNDKKKSEVIENLALAFDDVKLHQEGKKQLKTARELLNEL